jgi:hypothetical protein
MPYSIELVVLDGSGQDFVKAQYKPGSKLKLGARVRDQYGNIVQGGCTPQYRITDNVGANGGVRGSLADDTVTFGKTTGTFSVSVTCKEDPQITSERNQAPRNFETSEGTFAKCNGDCGQGGDKPAAKPSNAPIIIGVGLAVGVVLVAAIALSSSDDTGGGSSNNCGSVNCPSSCCRGSGEDVCCPSGYPVYCPATQQCYTGPQPSGPCDVNNTEVCYAVRWAPADPRLMNVRDVPHLVSLGLDPAQPAHRIVAPSGPAARKRHSGRAWVRPTLIAVSAVGAAVTTWLHLRYEKLPKFDVWLGNSAGGLTLEGSF